ncbi:CNTLN protein, partial [Chaetops frenatus]|nr:CNTLN protein [Chaetops frenatus]
QQEKEDLQGKLKLREHLPQTAGKSEATPAPAKNIDLEMKQLHYRHDRLSTASIPFSCILTKFSYSYMQSNFFPCRVSQLERDLTMKRHLIENLRSHLKANQENEKTSNETLESLERKVKAQAEDKKASIDSMKQRFNKSQYEQMYHKAKGDLEKKDLKLTKPESKMIETKCALTRLETAASQQLHDLAKQSTQALETLQKELLLTSGKVEKFKTFVK